MKRLLAASLVILAGLFLSQQSEAFFHEIGNMGFSGVGHPGGGAAILLEDGNIILLETTRKLLQE